MSNRTEEAALAGYLGKVMQEKLAQHSDTREHWRSENRDFLMMRLIEEMKELEAAMERGHSVIEVWREAADVANIAAMLADNYGGKP